MSVSAGSSATDCSWQRASRSTRSTSTRKVRLADRRVSRLKEPMPLRQGTKLVRSIPGLAVAAIDDLHRRHELGGYRFAFEHPYGRLHRQRRQLHGVESR